MTPSADSKASDGIKELQATEVGNYFVSNYPPFSTWTPAEIPLYAEALRTPLEGRTLALYVHIPFCRQRCHYCYFRVYPARDRAWVDAYIDAVLGEADLYAYFPAVRGRPLRSIYFGGGSPSYLEADQIERLLGGLQKRFDWSALEEFTFECEPRTVTPDRLKALREHGVTRISLGFQTLSPGVLKGVGRMQDRRLSLSAYDLVRRAGFQEVNIDLLAGLPGETDRGWLDTIRTVAGLEPECVTIYQLELTYNSRLRARKLLGDPVPIPDWPTKRRWVGEAFALLEEKGYTIASGYMAVRDPATFRFVYTVESFWRGADLLALGESAFGHFQGVHYQNADTNDRYLELVRLGKLPLWRARKLRGDEALRRELILAWKTGRVDCTYFRKKFGVEIQDAFRSELEKLEVRGFLEREGDTLRLTREGLLQVDALLELFYRPEHRGIRYT